MRQRSGIMTKAWRENQHLPVIINVASSAKVYNSYIFFFSCLENFTNKNIEKKFVYIGQGMNQNNLTFCQRLDMSAKHVIYARLVCLQRALLSGHETNNSLSAQGAMV
jgi:hypothetical protein